jgi:hypothetical protein
MYVCYCKTWDSKRKEYGEDFAMESTKAAARKVLAKKHAELAELEKSGLITDFAVWATADDGTTVTA